MAFAPPRLWSRLLRDVRGATAMVFALAAPVLFGFAGVAVDYASWTRQIEKLQSASDAAALAATKELSLSAPDQTRIEAVARSVVQAYVQPTAVAPRGASDPGDAVVVAAAFVNNRTGVKITLTQRKQAIMSRLVTPALTDIMVSATAAMTGNRKICVITLDTSSSATLELDNTAKLTANGCAVFGNSRDVKAVSAKQNSTLTAALICSSGGFEGSSINFVGQRMGDCPPQPDPLANRPTPPLPGCTHSTKRVIESDTTLSPCVFRGGIEIKKNARVTLNEGIYVIQDGQLKVDDTATLYGRNVGFYFSGTDATFEFTSKSSVNLGAPKDGAMYGILFFGDRNAPDSREYKITSENARTLLGTIYIPKGFLTIDAKNTVADQSAYTAIVAKRLRLKDAPNLVLNTNYSATDVPVPEGLGPSSNLRLIH